MVGKKHRRFLVIPMALVLAVTLVTTACTPAEAEALQGVLQSVDSANGKITIVTNDGKTVTLKIDTETEAAGGDNVTVRSLRPGTDVEIETKDKGRTARRIKAQERGQKGKEGEDRGKDGADGRKDTAATGWGIVELRVTDPPPAGVKSAIVYFSNIEVHKASQNEGESGDEDDNESDNITAASGDTTGSSNRGSSWLPITTNITSFDLMEIIGVEQILGSANLTAGRYTQIRMEVTKVEGVTTDNVSFTAEVPGEKLKLIGTFTVGGGNTTALTLDFDGEKSLIRTGEGKFIFKPVVKLLVNGKAAATDEDENRGKPREPGKSGNSGKPDDAGKPSDNRTKGNEGEGKGKSDQ